MTREQWKQKYDTDPAFRLERLLLLQRKGYKKHGRTNRDAYEWDIKRARVELKARRTTEGDAS